MHKTKYRKASPTRPPGVKSDPRGGKSKFLEKRLSSTAQNHYGDLEDTCRDKVTKVGVIVRYTKKVLEKKKRRLGSYLTPGGRLRFKSTVASSESENTKYKLHINLSPMHLFQRKALHVLVLSSIHLCECR